MRAIDDDTIARLKKSASNLWRLLEPTQTEAQIQHKVASVAIADLPKTVERLKYRLEERLFWMEHPHELVRAARGRNRGDVIDRGE